MEFSKQKMNHPNRLLLKNFVVNKGFCLFLLCNIFPFFVLLTTDKNLWDVPRKDCSLVLRKEWVTSQPGCLAEYIMNDAGGFHNSQDISQHRYQSLEISVSTSTDTYMWSISSCISPFLGVGGGGENQT